MKRINCLDDVHSAMRLNKSFKGFVELESTKIAIAQMSDELHDMKRFAETDEPIEWSKMVVIPPTLETCICEMLCRGAFHNIVLDNDKVYQINEVYADADDMTFIMRDVYVSPKDWENGDYIPSQTCYGWYAGCPTDECTDEFYGNLGPDLNMSEVY